MDSNNEHWCGAENVHPLLETEPWRQLFSLCPGLQFRYMELNGSSSISLDFHRREAFLEFGCLLSGHMSGCARLADGRELYFSGSPGQTWCSLCSPARGSITYLAGQPINVLLFLISGPLLKSLPLLPPSDTWSGRAGSSIINCGMTPSVRQIVKQILQIYQSPLPANMLLLMSKAYELLYHLSTAVPGELEDPDRQGKQRGVKRALEILNRNLDSPLTLSDLARQSGMCVTKLTEEFKKKTGTTVFGYLRQQRLTRAKELITIHGMSASEAAWEVGYSSLSSFHRAFCAHYGTTPGSYCRRA